MAESLMLPIRPVISTHHNHSNLEARLRQIDQQKGAFRYVTEQSLLNEIEQRNGGVQDVEVQGDSDDSSEDGGEDTPENRQEKVWKAKEKMLKLLDRAKNDTLHALDFVSLLLSKHSDAARSSLSPFLQHNVPIGTLEGRIVNHVEPSLSSRRRLDAVSRGWKTKSFISAAEKMLGAGTRLEAEAAHEASFWEQVAQVKEQGWAVSRLPRDCRVIGVHFGFPEAAPMFRNRGFALLRRGDDGRLQMDHTTSNSRLQVVVFRDGKESGRSVTSSKLISTESHINDQILNARNRLFEEELFYESCREGRSIANQGVSVAAKTVKFAVGDDTEINIDLTDPGERQGVSISPGKDQALAEFVDWALSILLIYAHSQKFARRSKGPQPMSLQPKPTPEYALLRPLMSHLRHESAFGALRSWFSSIETTFATSGLTLSNKRTSATSLNGTVSSGKESLVKFLMETANDTLELTLPTHRKTNLTMHTHMGPPMYGTEYTVDDLDYDSVSLKAPRMGSLIEVQSYINHILTIDLLGVIAAISTSNLSENEQDGNAGKAERTWNIRNPHSGEIFLEAAGRISLGISCRVQQGKIGIRIQGNRQAHGSTKIVLIWEGDKFSRAPAGNREETHDGRHLVEVLKDIIMTRPPQHFDD